MKTFKSLSGRPSLRVLIAALALLCFSSCWWNFDKGTPHPPIPSSHLAVIQASPDAPPLNLLLNFNAPINYVYNHNQPLFYGNTLNYFSIYTLTSVASIETAATSAQLYSDTIQVIQNQYYSLFIADTASRLQFLYLKDTLKNPGSGMAGIRFINLSPNAPAVDLSIQNSGAVVTNKPFMANSSFIPVAAGNYTLQVKQTGANNVLAALGNINLNSGSIYTIWLQGLNGSTSPSDELSINMITNTQF